MANIKQALVVRESVKADVVEAGVVNNTIVHDSAVWFADNVEAFEAKAAVVGVLATENEDVRSLRQLLVYGLKA